ncbi:hypothetical protein TAF16_1327 [Anoxybacillus flavithermus]|uniref:Uncharacterized protein n=1 Tax=Anoxybacillus flavithermus TaxID=33934 RepID=A0A178TE11_9BACL|nr:hypothetical protein TAF16_1327 [Anoxybacillus flavithermus]
MELFVFGYQRPRHQVRQWIPKEKELTISAPQIVLVRL